MPGSIRKVKSSRRSRGREAGRETGKLVQGERLGPAGGVHAGGAKDVCRALAAVAGEGRRAFASVFRRCVNIDRTIASNDARRQRHGRGPEGEPNHRRVDLRAAAGTRPAAASARGERRRAAGRRSTGRRSRLVPGPASSRSATSRCNISVASRIAGSGFAGRGSSRRELRSRNCAGAKPPADRRSAGTGSATRCCRAGFRRPGTAPRALRDRSTSRKFGDHEVDVAGELRARRPRRCRDRLRWP